MTLANIGIGMRLSTDGTAVAIDWSADAVNPPGSRLAGADPKGTTTALPIAAIPTMIDMLLGSAEEARQRQGKAIEATPKLDRQFHPSNMQLIAPDDGSDWVLRISIGILKLDFILRPNDARALQDAVMKSPQAKKSQTDA